MSTTRDALRYSNCSSSRSQVVVPLSAVVLSAVWALQARATYKRTEPLRRRQREELEKSEDWQRKQHAPAFVYVH